MKTMEPGSCHNVLDDHFGFWNWQKYVRMGKSLIHKYKVAIEERNVQVEGHCGLSANLPANLVVLWDLLCELWEGDMFPKTAENPFHVDGEFLSEKGVEKELEEEEEECKCNGGVVCHATSVDKFLTLGLELEESQWKVQSVAVKYANKTLTEHQDTSLADQRSVLHTKLKAWEPLRAIYLLGLVQYLTDIGESNSLSLEDTDRSPEDTKLWLPLSIPANRRVSVCIEGLSAIEDRLWTAQCNNTLQGIRHTLRLKLCMVQFKNKNTWGQHAMTRSHSVIDRVHQRALAFATRYRTAWAAKRELVGEGKWEQTLRVLDSKDIQAYTDPECVVHGTGRRGTNEDSDKPQRCEDVVPQEINVELEERGVHGGTGKMRQTLSWIWLTSNIKIDDGTDKNDEILQSEWCRSHSHAKRSQEEVLLLREEMWRVLQFLKWKANWWDERRSIQNTWQDIALAQSLNAYACQQRVLQLLLRQSFQDIWMTLLEDMQKEVEVATLDKLGADDEDGDDEEEDESDFEEVDGEGSNIDGSDDKDTMGT